MAKKPKKSKPPLKTTQSPTKSDKRQVRWRGRCPQMLYSVEMDMGVLRSFVARSVDAFERNPALARYIVPGSTPVFSFGDAGNAEVATLALNPSPCEFGEFWDKNYEELPDEKRRLETLTSLEIDGYCQLEDKHIKKICASCNQYFQKNPYWCWFKHLENTVLKSLCVSYHKGTACHLDLIQWATRTRWKRIPSGAQDDFMKAGADFLHHQLQNEKTKILLLNGRLVVDLFCKYFTKREDLSWEKINDFDVCEWRRSGQNMLIIGYNLFFQHDWMKENECEQQAQAKKIAEIVKSKGY